ncbi:MAG: LytTR family DNA-binding domain-containing protein, partial [Bacteroidota bacterium]
KQIPEEKRWSGIARELEVPILYASGERLAALQQKFPHIQQSNFLSLPASSSELQAVLKPYVRSNSRRVTGMDQGHLLLKTSEGLLERIAFVDVQVLEAVGNYCHFYTTSKRYTHRMPLKNYRQIFPESQFVRIHRNYVINLRFLTSISLQKGVVEVAGKPYPLSQKYKNDLLTRFPKV